MMTEVVTHLTAEQNPNFALPESYGDTLYDRALGPEASDADKKKFAEVVEAQRKSYAGDAGRMRLRQATVALGTRDSLLFRLQDIKCPVLWIVGSKDPSFPEKAAKEDSSMFKSEVQFEVIDGAYHYPTWSHAEKVNKLVLDFVKKYGGQKDARAMREAVGMVDI
jgi:pimeloyl-ACP methyl ester carboxylesterase